MNSRFLGSAQNRPRVFIVGVAKNVSAAVGQKFKWPGEIPMPDISHFLKGGNPKADIEAMPLTRLQNYHSGLLKIESDKKLKGCHVLADLDASESHGIALMRDCCPCITLRRAKNFSLFSFRQRRFLTLKELMSLQGIPPCRLAKPPNVSEYQFAAMVGNAMDVRVMMALLAEVLRILGWQKHGLVASSQKSAAGSQKHAAGSQKRAGSEQTAAAASQKRKRT